MKIFQTINIATIFLTLAISGSSGSLNENFDILFQNSFKISNLSGIFLKDYFYEGYGNGEAYIYNCVIDQIIILMAKGTDRLTGIDSNYIAEILNGQNSPPFQSQLNCIKGGLIEMQNEIKNARNLVKLFKKDFKVPQTTFKTCDDFVKFVMPHQNKFLEVFVPEISTNEKYVNFFNSIGMVDLFENYLNAVAVCSFEGVGIVGSNFAHVDQQEGIDYVNGVRKNLSYPLNCTSNILDTDKSVIETAYAAIIQQC